MRSSHGHFAREQPCPVGWGGGSAAVRRSLARIAAATSSNARSRSASIGAALLRYMQLPLGFYIYIQAALYACRY
jgi:hypothetical protein